jgi:hypothetical protein
MAQDGGAMIRIPLDPIGYSVDGDTIHTRYADHVSRNSHRTRTVKGVETLMAGKKAKVCGECYPSPQYRTDEKPKALQQRRSTPA